MVFNNHSFYSVLLLSAFNLESYHFHRMYIFSIIRIDLFC